MIKYLIRFFSLSFVLFSLCSCQTTNINKINTNHQTQTQPGLTYLAFTNKTDSTFSSSLEDLIISFFPESNFISQTQSTLSPYLSNTYHYYLQTDSTGQKKYTIKIALNKSIPTEQISLLTSNFYQIKTQTDYLIITNTDQNYSIQNPIKNSILTIFSIDPNLFYNLNISDQTQLLNIISLQQLSQYLPISINEINNQIVVNQIPTANINPGTQTFLNYHPNNSEIFFKQKINNLLNSFHANYYLNNNMFVLDSLDTISISFDQDKFKLTYSYQNIKDASEIFSKINDSLSLQKSYVIRTTTLPDNTISTQFKPDSSSKITAILDQNLITMTDIQAQNISINQTDRQITITNTTENFEPKSYPNQINFENLINIYPVLIKLNFIKSIQYYLTNNQLSGYVIK